KDDPLADLATALEETARTTTAALLREGSGTEIAVAIAESATSLMDDTAREVEAVPPPPQPMARRKGWPTRGHAPARTRPQSVVRIAEHVRRTWPVIERIKLQQRIDAHVEATKDAYAFPTIADRPACPFLVDNACAVHEVRPMVCRAFNSSDLAA